MSTTTDKHPRIIVAEISVRILKEGLKLKGSFRPKLTHHQLNQLAHDLNSEVQKIKYSFISKSEAIILDLYLSII